ncbi:VC0807 family protein [Amycolatopsis saalfeldensis]|uniref:VC0807 family protein n=1 Tax=Amycolatopsis saalfeldensis TaxID=394193 RepID=UPI0015A5AB42|nr:VC0807 family protein [Amycolatopsis saalfeldensis]
MVETTETAVGHTEAKAGGPLRNPAAKTMLKGLFWDFGPALIAYFAAQLFGASTYAALLAATLVSGVRVVWVAVRQRRLDPFALFLLIMFGVGLVLTFVTGDVRFMLAKDSATSAVSGLVLVGSCLIGRPLVYHAAKRMAASAGREPEFAATARTPQMWQRWRRISLVWGFGLLAESALRIVGIYVLPLTVAADLSQVLQVVVLVALGFWTFRSTKRPALAPATR